MIARAFVSLSFYRRPSVHDGRLNLGVSFLRQAMPGRYPFVEIFAGFEKVEVVRHIFGEKVERVLRELEVVVYQDGGYMYVNDKTGHIHVCQQYLATADERYLYLDVVHELVHIRQHIEGMELFDEKYDYLKRPTEIEAYSVTLKEARRIGMRDEEIIEYLRVDWVKEKDFLRFLKVLGVGLGPSFR